MDRKLPYAVLYLVSSSEPHLSGQALGFLYPSVSLLAEISCHLEILGIFSYLFIVPLPCGHKVNYGIDNNNISLLVVIE